ncbi:MAG: hypothetical protein WB622_14100 [Acidobacteriaceae bacterium]
MLRHRQRGQSLRQLARTYQCSRATVHHVLHQQIRPSHKVCPGEQHLPSPQRRCLNECIGDYALTEDHRRRQARSRD